MKTVSDTTQRQPKPSNIISRLFWLIGLFIVAFYGFLAFNSGIKLSPITNSTADSAAVVTRIIQQADQQQTIVEADIDQVIPTWASCPLPLAPSNLRMAPIVLRILCSTIIKCNPSKNKHSACI